MKTKEVSLGKEFKIGLANYSNITIRADIKWEVGENEEIDWNSCWDEINRQLQIQSEGLDPSWIKDTKDYKNFFKVTINVPKESKGGQK